MFTCQRIDERDNAGQLTATGVEWTERSLRLEAGMKLLLFVGLLVAVPAVAATFMLAISKGLWALVPAAIAAVAFSPFFWHHRVTGKGKPRSLIFRRNGTVSAPYGLPNWPKVREISGQQTDVVSFEAGQTLSNLEVQYTDYSHGVLLYKRDGDMVVVAKHLHPSEAHKVAVQLSIAIAELRAALAIDTARTGVRFTQAKPSPRASGTKADTIID